MTEPAFDINETSLNANSKFAHVELVSQAIGCVNAECRELTVQVSINSQKLSKGSWKDEEVLFSGRLIPESEANPQPEHIPAVLREDYIEACRIRDLSPKASATLSRRCLQGMIRDFCDISKPTLYKEIETLKAAVEQGSSPKGVTEESVDAIDQVRGIGNIGAHMEKDINVIVSVEPEEAQMLIELIELLFEEWYVARELRTNKLARIKLMAEDKKQLIKLQKNTE